MLYKSLFVAALGLEGALAQPAHRHHHKHRRGLKDVDWKKVHYDFSNTDWSKVDFTGKTGHPIENTSGSEDSPGAGAPSYSPPPPPPVEDKKKEEPKIIPVIPLPASSPDTESSSESTGEDHTGGGHSGLQGFFGGAQGHFGGRTTGHQGENKDVYIGNVGVPFGHNIMGISLDDVDKQKYTITFKNIGQKEIKVIVWQNPGRNGTPLGGKGEDPVLTIQIPAGESRATAYDEDTHGAFSLDCPRGFDGSTTCVRGEYNFGDQCPKQWDNPNGAQGWSAFDRSCIEGGCDDVLKMTCLNCPDDGKARRVSDKGINDFTSADQFDRAVPVPAGEVHILAELAAA
ncbi:MAG: hypothetical protein LQ351_000619 [Letrouitia transgressa]|nr:MAG: hypothetical protein LQ351_000619 [Letrouitia transgressa]